jgi:hypothetical protein
MSDHIDAIIATMTSQQKRELNICLRQFVRSFSRDCRTNSARAN